MSADGGGHANAVGVCADHGASGEAAIAAHLGRGESGKLRHPSEFVELCLPLYRGVLDLDLRGASLANLASLAVVDRRGELAVLVTLRFVPHEHDVPANLPSIAQAGHAFMATLGVTCAIRDANKAFGRCARTVATSQSTKRCACSHERCASRCTKGHSAAPTRTALCRHGVCSPRSRLRLMSGRRCSDPAISRRRTG